MDKTVEQSAPMDLLQVVAWFHANRKQIITISAVVLVAGAAVGGYVWHKNYAETQANIALSEIKTPMPSKEGIINPADALPYVKVADDYAGTSAGSRALLLAGQTFFAGGKFDDAKLQFEKFLSQYSESPLANQAALGVAASLEAEGKTAEAATRYQDIVNRHQGESIMPQAKSALARLYVAQNKPEQALQLYQELARANNNDTWSAEADIQIQELLTKYPNLRKQLAPPAPAASTAPAPAPGKSPATMTLPPVK